MTSGQEGVTFRDPGDLANVLVTVATRLAASPDSPLASSRAWLLQHPPERWTRSGTRRRGPSYSRNAVDGSIAVARHAGNAAAAAATTSSSAAVATSVIGSRGPTSNS